MRKEQLAVSAIVAAGLTVLTPQAMAASAGWESQTDGNWSDAANWNPNTTYPNGIDEIATMTSTGLGGGDGVREVTLTENITIGRLSLPYVSGKRYVIQSAAGETLTFASSSGNPRITTSNYAQTHEITSAIIIPGALDVYAGWSPNLTISGTLSSTTGSETIDLYGGAGGGTLSLNLANNLANGTINVGASTSTTPTLAGAATSTGVSSALGGPNTTINLLHGTLSLATLGGFVNYQAQVVVQATNSINQSGPGLFGQAAVGSVTVKSGATANVTANIGHDLAIGPNGNLTIESGAIFAWNDSFWVSYIGDPQLLAGSTLEGDGTLTLFKQQNHAGDARTYVIVDPGAVVAPGIGPNNTGILEVANLLPPPPGDRGEFPIPMPADTIFEVDINGLAVGSQYDQLVVTGGAVSLGADLSVKSTTPQVAGSVYIIINNDGTDAVVGTFNGLPEGATLTDNLLTQYDISYVGGDGNDVTLTVSGCTECSVFNAVVVEALCAATLPTSAAAFKVAVVNLVQDTVVGPICEEEPGGGSEANCENYILSLIMNEAACQFFEDILLP